jgi:hypothetical protein
MSVQAPLGPAKSDAPGRIWYVIALLVGLAGFAGAGLLVYSQLSKLTSTLVQVVVPGETVLTLEPGDYTIFHEYQSVVGAKIYSNTDVSGLVVSVEPTDGGAPVTLQPPSVNSNYQLGGRSGYSVLAFEVSAPGTYRLSAGYPEGQEKPEAVLAVGKGFTAGLLSIVFGAIAIAFAGLAIAVAIAVVTFRRRRRVLAPGS